MAKKKKAANIQNDVKEQAHKIWLAGLGALALAEEEGSKLFRNLVERGESIETRGKDQVEKAKGAVTGVKVVAESYIETFEKTLDEKVTNVIHKLGVPTKDEIDSLSAKVEELTKSIDKLKKAPAAKPRATRSRSTRSTAAKKSTTTKADVKA